MCGIVAIPLYTKRCCVLIPSLEATTPIYKATMYADTVTLSIYLLVDRAIGSGSLADGSLADGRGLLMSSPASFHAFSLSIHLPKHQQLPFMPFLCQYTHQSTNSFPSRLLFVITLTKTPTASIHAFSLSIHSPKHQQNVYRKWQLGRWARPSHELPCPFSSVHGRSASAAAGGAPIHGSTSKSARAQTWWN